MLAELRVIHYVAMEDWDHKILGPEGPVRLERTDRFLAARRHKTGRLGIEAPALAPAVIESRGFEVERGPISKIRSSDGCKGDELPLAVYRWYDFHEFGCHLGIVG